MARDPILVTETCGWLRKARRDLRSADHGLSALPPLLDDAAFHAQQCAEKSLKAFLTWHDVAFRKTHSLEELGEQCLRLDPTLKAWIDPAVPLTEYAWKFRYPGDPEEPTTQEAQDAVRIARALFEVIVSGLPAEAQEEPVAPKDPPPTES